MNYYIIGFISLIITLAAQVYLQVTYNKTKLIKNRKKLSGQEVARKILDANGLENIYVVETKGYLSDHYDPGQKVVRLSSSVYGEDSIAAIAIAAHEVGHAIQDKNGYFLIKLRKFIFPLVRLASRFGYIAIIIGLFTRIFDLILIGLALLVIILIFQLITLPVEFNASKRAKKQLIKCKIIENDELKEATLMLNAAALTYVAGLLTTVLEILRILALVSGRRD